jgi:hypothetical protein
LYLQEKIMHVPLPLPTPSGLSPPNLISYATDPSNHLILNQISSVLSRLSQDELAGLSIAALNEGYEPDTMFVDFSLTGSRAFDQCIQHLQDLSLPGKVALVRSIAELLAVSIGFMPNSPSLPPAPDAGELKPL